MARTQMSQGKHRNALKYDAFRRGDVYYVDSNNGIDSAVTGAGTDPVHPLATIGQAITNAQANDTIVCAAGHAETISAAAGLDFSVAGLLVVGLGNGSKRPTLTLDTATAADIDVTAAGVTLENFVIDLTGVDAIAAGIDVNAADFTMRDCNVITADSGGQAVIGVIADANADRLLIEDCIFEGSSNAGTTSQIQLTGCDRARIINCQMYGDCSAANIEVKTTAVTRLLVERCDLENFNAVDVCFEGLAAATGSLRWNTCRVATDAQTTWLNTLGSLQLFENYGVNNDAETGKLIGTVSV